MRSVNPGSDLIVHVPYSLSIKNIQIETACPDLKLPLGPNGLIVSHITVIQLFIPDGTFIVYWKLPAINISNSY